jgi:hypothetical protein
MPFRWLLYRFCPRRGKVAPPILQASRHFSFIPAIVWYRSASSASVRDCQ